MKYPNGGYRIIDVKKIASIIQKKGAILGALKPRRFEPPKLSKVNRVDSRFLVALNTLAFAKTRFWHSHFTLQLRFRGKFCYIDGLEKKDQSVFPLCRLRYYDKNEWGLDFYTYSNDRYQRCNFSNGSEKGTLEQAIEICEGYLQ